MRVCFRVDASRLIGSGHLMRCTYLADELQRHGIESSFICRELEGNLIDYLEEKDYKVYRLPYTQESFQAEKDGNPYRKWLEIGWQTDANQTAGIIKNIEPRWVIVDHYAIDRNWEKEIRLSVKRIMVIDDLANRQHECDLLLDQNLCADMQHRYDKLVPERCHKLLGPEFALLRPEFREARGDLRKRESQVKKILIFFGGSDTTAETLKALKAVANLKNKDVSFDVLIGINNIHKKEIEGAARDLANVRCHHRVENVAKFMCAADLYLGAAGITTWERCCLGLSSLVIAVADNQVEIVKYLAEQKFLHYIGESRKVKSIDIQKDLEYFLANPQMLQVYSKNSLGLVDGLGTIRCVESISNHCSDKQGVKCEK